ncbi:sodium-dependent transporter [Chondrinema litorale]|uniref:sodium-dependent transporter n=1 Tax=Chondrinema litorale TaxID=2994555 RepID=UPI002543D323|nr:sodium-dependent transporter [Chondrinema litorale]UZR95636.1 sodium-dependent transporter [Chondrinema litorale]
MALKEEFSNRWGIILASLGMAVGAGNLWRFPRLAGQYGGTFLILWIFFLIFWSIPILLAEFSIGKKIRKGVIGSFAGIAGSGFTWMGFFIAACTLGITFYYSVVTAWSLQYLGLSITNLFNTDTSFAEKLSAEPDFLNNYWADISNANTVTIILHVIAVILGILLLYKGIQKGLEKANRILIPSLFVLLVIISVVALNMENGVKGLEYMFSIKPELFGNATIWIEALSQSAWSTGAGWGLIMTISSYSRNKEDVTLNTFVGSFGNNTASILAGIAILPSVFALAETEEAAIAFLQSGNQSLTFTVIPQLFAEVTGGDYLAVIFFLAFFMAAFSSLLPMLELFIKIIGDMGLTRHQASIRAGLFCIILGFPSAYSLDFFNNQDWVWGIGLVISGLFIIFAAVKYGVLKFKKDLIDIDSDFKVNNSYFAICLYCNIFLGIFLIYWWMSQGYSQYPWFNEAGNWNLFDVYSNASIITQWVFLLLVGVIFNRLIYKTFSK